MSKTLYRLIFISHFSSNFLGLFTNQTIPFNYYLVDVFICIRSFCVGWSSSSIYTFSCCYCLSYSSHKDCVNDILGIGFSSFSRFLCFTSFTYCLCFSFCVCLRISNCSRIFSVFLMIVWLYLFSTFIMKPVCQ